MQSNDCKFAPHLEGSNADFAPHMGGSHADFAPHMEQRHSFWYEQIAKNAISASIFFFFFSITYIIGIYMIYVTTFENKNILKESTFKRNSPFQQGTLVRLGY